MEQCSGCRFWLNWDSESTNLGECHRYPPQMETARQTDVEGETIVTVRPSDGGWPVTAPDDWCGEYQRAPRLAAATGPGSTAKPPDVGPAGI